MQLKTGTCTVDLYRPVVMAIVNVTPDSFYASSRTPSPEAIRRRVDALVADGAAILDVGGYSSRPGAAEVSPDEEIRRLSLAVEIIRTEHPGVAVSLDTFRGAVAAEIVRRHGPCIVNDITGGEDPELIALAGAFDLPYIAMHMRGTPETMQQLVDYTDLVGEVSDWLGERCARLREAGVGQIVIDPGFGFAKTTAQNYELLAGMDRLKGLGYPLLAGVSRKSMICVPLGIAPAEALAATTAIHWECLRRGASILRVHDVREAAQVIRLYALFSEQGGEGAALRAG